MSDREDIVLMAHLMRRAGFGATRDELERLVEQGYEETVERLLDPPDEIPRADHHLLFRYIPATETGGPSPAPGAANWLYHMINTQRPLEEKIALFWHNVFATANSKVDNDNHLTAQIDMFRDHGMGNYRDLLLKVARNPAMIFWLDNNENHKRAPNENWGRELLELFSLGVGNYTETDVFECARAFTGWTIAPKIPPAAAPQVLVELRVPARGARLRPEGLPRQNRRLRRRGHHRHHTRPARVSQVHRAPPVQLLRRRRAAGAGVVRRAAKRPRGD